MINNDILRSLRYTFNISEKQMVEIFKLSGLEIPSVAIQDLLKSEEDEHFKFCDDETMAHFLDGFIYFKRGKDESRPPLPFELPISNNLVLKKLRVALQLKEEDMHEILELANHPLGRAELSALLRKRGQPNYRECGDQVLRYFLKGLTLRYRENRDKI